MDARAATLEEFLGSVLRGAAKILGCGSTSLILINKKTHQIGVRLGTMAGSDAMVAEVEQVLGGSLGENAFSIESAQDSLVYRAWRERAPLETSSLAELVGSAFPRSVIEQMSRVIGEHRFICVPALSGARNYGVLLFQKEGRHPFNRQQREVIVRYARRIGEIIENDLTGQGRQRVAELPAGRVVHLLFDGQGRLLGQSAAVAAGSELVAALGARARAFAAGEDGAAEGEPRAELSRLRLGDGDAVLCAVPDGLAKRGFPLENALLQLTLGDPVPSLCLDPQLRVTSCNAATEQHLGYAPAELAGRPIAALFARPREIVELLTHQVVDPSSPHGVEAAVVVRRDGTLAPAHVEALLLADEREEAVGFLVLIRELQRDEQGDASSRLVRQERLATMGEMAAQLAHELRNPLVAVGASLESLARDPDLAGEQRELVSAVADELARMDMLLKDHLAARHELCFTDVTLADVVQDARRLLEGAYRLAGKRIVVETAGAAAVRGDHESLKHVVFNLLLNALEASPVGGEVRCSVNAQQRTASIVVEDRGPGLGASVEECLRPFFTTKRNGTGLGLPVCERIARAHGGLVELASGPGGGCRAALVLPLRRGAPGGDGWSA